MRARIAAAAELFVHATQAKIRGNMDKPEKELDQLRAIPGVAGSRELASFEAAFRAMATGLMIDGTPEAALERVRRPPNDELEAQTLERLIPVLRDLLRGMSDTEAPSPAEIDLGRLEAELKMRIAGGVYGPAVGAVPVAPAKPGSAVDGPRPQGGGTLPPAPPTSSGPSPVPFERLDAVGVDRRRARGGRRVDRRVAAPLANGARTKRPAPTLADRGRAVQ